MSVQLSAAVILDSAAEYSPLPGYRLAHTDIDVVRLYPFRDQRVWAQGRRAAEVCGRLAEEQGISCVELYPCAHWLNSLRVPESLVRDHLAELQAAFRTEPPFDANTAAACVERWLAERMPGLFQFLDVPDTLAIYLAEGRADPVRRACLLWLCQRRPASQRHRLIAQILLHDDPVAAWLGLNSVDDLQWADAVAGFVPKSLPPAIADRVARHWHDVLVSPHGFDLAARLMRMDVGGVRKIVRNQAKEVYEQKPKRERAAVEDACRAIFGDEWVIHQLATQQNWLQLDSRSDLPTMLDWYNVYRAKADWSGPLDEKRVSAARSFQDWFLDRERFPKWCSQGERGPLSFAVNPIIRDTVKTASAVLLLLVDGLGYCEHNELTVRLLDQAAVLRVTRDQPVLATLPTITAVCKGSLLSGTPQREWQTAQYKEMATRCRRHNTRSYYFDRFAVGEVTEKLLDPQTSLVVINYNDLDTAMHAATDAAAIPAIIAGKIAELTMNLARVAEDVHGELEQFAIIVASDHGQVVGGCEPTALLTDQIVKQRLRLANGQPQPFEVPLPRSMTLCTEDYYAIADGRAWSMGKRLVFGCHGGLFPEEVVTRVTVLGFRQPTVEIKIEGFGKGVAGISGAVNWRVKNLSPVPVTIRKVLLSWPGGSVPLLAPSHPVPSILEKSFPEQKVEGWPTAEQGAQATLEVEWIPYAGREVLNTRGPVRIESESGYEASPFEL